MESNCAGFVRASQYDSGMPKGPRKYTDAQLIQGVSECQTMRELLTFLGLAPYGGNYENIRRRISELGLDSTLIRTFHRPGPVWTCTDVELSEAVKSSRSFAQVLTKLGIPSGGNQGRLKRRVERLGLDTSHFSGMSWRKGSTTPVVPRRPLEEFLVAGRPVSTDKLRRRLIEEGFKERSCELCRKGTWNGQPIPLELDHINGRREDNRLENLRLLCPNCHAQTPTYRGRNIGAASGYSVD